MIPLTLTLSPRRGERELLAAVLIAIVACNDPRASEQAAGVAASFTRQHADHKLHASVGGSDCRVLLISIASAADDDLVESIHYGTGGYDAFGGAEQFAYDYRFRAVIYRDSTDNVWTYGATTKEEARSLPRCR